eukprot:1301390-Rhodomonas_salina.1
MGWMPLSPGSLFSEIFGPQYQYRQPPGVREEYLIPCLAERMLASGVHTTRAEDSKVDKNACKTALLEGGWKLKDTIESG